MAQTARIHSLTVLEARNPKLRCQQGWASSKIFRGESFLPSPASGDSKCLLAYGCITTSASIWSFPLWFHLSPIRTFFSEFRVCLGNSWCSHLEIINLITWARPIFPNEVTGSGGYDVDISFGGHHQSTGEGNGNPLQRSCLENHRDGGVWWAAIYGVAQSRTGPKQLSSISLLQSSSCISFGVRITYMNRASAGDARDADSIPRLGSSSGVENGNPLRYSCLKNSMDREAWQAIVHRVTKSQTQLNAFILAWFLA